MQSERDTAFMKALSRPFFVCVQQCFFAFETTVIPICGQL